MKKIMLNIPPIKDKSVENILREIIRQINLSFDEVEIKISSIEKRVKDE